MKKQFFFMAAAAIALASCSSEDVVELNNGNAIDFRVAMGAVTNSRGVETKTDNLDKFYVSAVNSNQLYFSDVLFSKGENSNFTSEHTYFWPGDESDVHFYAYSYYTSDDLKVLDSSSDGVTINASSQKISFTPEASPADQLDLVVATEKGSSKTEGAVSLQFDHALSQIVIKAKNTNPNYVYTVAGIKIANVKPTGEYDYSTSEWIASGDATSYTVDLNESSYVTLNNEAQGVSGITEKNNTGAMLIPQQLTEWKKSSSDNGTYLAVKIKITMNGTGVRIYPSNNSDEEYAYACVAIGTNWEPKNCYIYTLDFSDGAGYTEDGDPILGGAIMFTATVNDWTETTVEDLNM